MDVAEPDEKAPQILNNSRSVWKLMNNCGSVMDVQVIIMEYVGGGDLRSFIRPAELFRDSFLFVTINTHSFWVTTVSLSVLLFTFNEMLKTLSILDAAVMTQNGTNTSFTIR